MPRPLTLPVARDPLPDPVELLRLAFDDLGHPVAVLERWLDRLEAVR